MTHRQINTIVPHNRYLREFIYFEMLGRNKYLNDIGSGGTATLNINTGVFSNIEITLPNKELLIEFSGLTTPLFEKVLQNNIQIKTLTKTRDTLLPKLMSGEIRMNSEQLKVKNKA